MSNLEQLFSQYREAVLRAEELKRQVEIEALALGKSVELSGVKSTFYKPSFETGDHKAAAIAANVDPAIIEKYTTVPEPSTRGAEVCKEAGVEVPPGAPKAARVIIKVLQ